MLATKWFERSSEFGWQKKKVNKKKGTTTTRRRVPPILYLVKIFTFLSKFLPFSLFQPPKTFSYVFDFHNLSKIHSEKTIFKGAFTKKKNWNPADVEIQFFENISWSDAFDKFFFIFIFNLGFMIYWFKLKQFRRTKIVKIEFKYEFKKTKVGK